MEDGRFSHGWGKKGKITPGPKIREQVAKGVEALVKVEAFLDACSVQMCHHPIHICPFGGARMPCGWRNLPDIVIPGGAGEVG